VVDAYSGYDAALSLDGRSTAYCLAHARRKFDELFKANASVVAGQAIQRIAWLYRIEADAKALTADQRLQMRQERSQPLWDEMHVWLQLERTRVPDGSAIAKAIDYSLNHWVGLGRFLLDGDVPIDNNHVENRIRPWALGQAQLALHRQPAGGRAGRGGDEPAAVGQAQWARALGVPEGRAHAAAHAVEQPDRGVAAAHVAAC
jgi:transposase